MGRYVTLSCAATFAALALAGPCCAQEADGEWVVSAELVLAGGALDDEKPQVPAANGLLGSLVVTATRSDTFDNGLTLSWRGSAALERDASNRPAFAGSFDPCAGVVALCNRGGGAVSPATGLAPVGARLDDDAFPTLEAAAVALSGPWGEGVLGWDVGAATRLDARPPTVLTRVSAFSPGLDPTGLGFTRARNDVTGSSAKATYLSPRWLGLRVGASYAPKADLRGRDFDPDPDIPGAAAAKLTDIWEGAVSFSRQFAEQDLRVRTAVTYVSAASDGPPSVFGRYEAWGAGLELERDGWTGGIRWLASNNAARGPGDYEAWEAGLTHESDGWRVGIEAGWSQDDLSGLKGSSWLLGGKRQLNDNIGVGLAWTSAEGKSVFGFAPGLGHNSARNEGLIVELTVRN